MNNIPFQKAVSLLAHPVSLFMLAFLLVNDHLLRRLWPSWWTGKLGDVAWLVFFPFALAAALSWLLPLREPAREAWTFRLAFATTGLFFALAKTLPSVHAFTVQSFQAVLGLPSTLVRDPSDLLALPALALSWRMWRTGVPPARANRAGLGLAALPLAALLTIANSAMPDYGISCLNVDDAGITGQAAYTGYHSPDGGLTWESAPPDRSFECSQAYAPAQDWQEARAATAGLDLRFKRGGPIESSSDGGQTWREAYRPQLASEAIQSYIVKVRTGNPTYSPGPLQVVEDPATGNMIFAMGQEGVLIRTRSGEWRPVAVGPYQPVSAKVDFPMIQVLLGNQLILALITALLIYILLAAPRLKLSKRWTAVILWLMVLAAAVAWLGVVLLFPPAQNGYSEILVALGLIASGTLLVVLALAVSVDLFRSPAQRPLLPILLLAALGGGVLFFLPSLLWAFNILPSQTWAVAFSLLLVAAAFTAAFWKIQSLRGPLSPPASR